MPEGIIIVASVLPVVHTLEGGSGSGGCAKRHPHARGEGVGGGPDGVYMLDNDRGAAVSYSFSGGVPFLDNGSVVCVQSPREEFHLRWRIRLRGSLFVSTGRAVNAFGALFWCLRSAVSSS